MRNAIRSRLSYANVTATLALFIALGGVSYAATALPAHSVGTRQLRANAVTSAKVKNGSLRAVDLSRATKRALKGAKGDTGPQGAPGAQGAPGPQGPRGSQGPVGPATGAAGGDLSGNYPNPSIANGAVTTTKFAPGAKAPDADTLDGIDSAGFVQGTGRALLDSAVFNLSGPGGTAPAGQIAGLGTFQVGGANAMAGDDCRVSFTNTSGGPLAVNGDANPGLANNATIELTGVDARPSGSQATFTIALPQAAEVATGIATVTFGFPQAQNSLCAGAVHALVTG